MAAADQNPQDSKLYCINVTNVLTKHQIEFNDIKWI